MVNDNGRSYTPTIGGLATALTSLRTDPRYERVLEVVKRRLNAVPGVGHAAYDALHAVRGHEGRPPSQGLFEDLGLDYVGPIDGHDGARWSTRYAGRGFDGPVIVHAITRKGDGYDPAERHEADQSTRPALRRADRRGEAQGPHLDRPLLRRDRRGGRAPEGRRGHHRGHDPPGSTPSPRRSPIARSTWASRNSTRSPPPPASPWGGAARVRRLRHVPQPGVGPGPQRRRPPPLRGHVRPRPPGVTGDDGASHNGLFDLTILSGARPAPRRTPRRPPGCGSCSTRRSTSPMRRPWCASPRARRPRTSTAIEKAGGADVLVRTGDEDVLVAVGRLDGHRGRRRRRAARPRRASASPSSTRAGSSPSTRRSSSWPATTSWSSASRTTAAWAAAGPRCCRPSTTPA